jgi:hypothetical protein
LPTDTPRESRRRETPEEADIRVRTSLVAMIAALLLTLAGAYLILELAATQKAQICIERNSRACAVLLGDMPSGRAR